MIMMWDKFKGNSSNTFIDYLQPRLSGDRLVIVISPKPGTIIIWYGDCKQSSLIKKANELEYIISFGQGLIILSLFPTCWSVISGYTTPKNFHIMLPSRSKGKMANLILNKNEHFLNTASPEPGEIQRVDPWISEIPHFLRRRNHHWCWQKRQMN